MKTSEKKAPLKIAGTSKKVSTSDLESKVKAKKATAEVEEGGEKKKKKKAKEGKGEATQRATNYNFPKDCTSAKDRKSFRTKARKTNAAFEDRYAEAKSGKSKEKSGTVRKEWDAWKAETYLNADAVGAEAE